MNFLLSCLLLAAPMTNNGPAMTLFDFSDPDAVRAWVPVNDTVMGGVSSSRMAPTDEGAALFAGHVSLDNNGGFASVRSRPQPRDLSRFAGLVLHVRGDGQSYKLNLRDDAYLDGVQHRGVFDTERDQWQTVRLRFDELVPTFRGRLVRGAEPLDLSHVTTFGLMISDKQAGPFRLEIARIEAFTD